MIEILKAFLPELKEQKGKAKNNNFFLVSGKQIENKWEKRKFRLIPDHVILLCFFRLMYNKRQPNGTEFDDQKKLKNKFEREGGKKTKKLNFYEFIFLSHLYLVKLEKFCCQKKFSFLSLDLSTYFMMSDSVLNRLCFTICALK